MGSEKTILRKASWLESLSVAGEKQAKSAETDREANARSVLDPNSAIMRYLGSHVPAPADLDGKYAPAKLMAAFAEIGAKAGWRAQRLAVDESEFTFLVYGVLGGRERLSEKAIRELKGYDYGGSVTGMTGQGATYFALNMTPLDRYPKAQIEACNRRLMVRLQMLAERARNWE